MEAHSDTDEPELPLSPETAEVPADPASTPADELEEEEPEETLPPGGEPASDPLSELAAAAAQRRLPPAEEERAAKLLREELLEGRTGVTKAIEHLPKLPWVIGVNGVCAAWEEMKPTFRTRLLAGLGRVESESARRVRLSLARGLFKMDQSAALKIAVSVAKDMRDKETGGISARDAHLLSSVFIGRAKPWIAQLPLAELKPAEAELLVHQALLTICLQQHAPATQVGVLRWACEAGRLEKLPPVVLEALGKTLNRWSAKWRQTLMREVPALPEEIVPLLRLQEIPAAPVEEPRSAAPPAGRREETADKEIGSEENSREPREPRDEEEDEDEREDREEREEREGGEEREQPTPRPGGQRPRPVYESKTVPMNRRGQDRPERSERSERPAGGANFNLPDALRQIDNYVSGLRNDLQIAQNKLRHREEEGRKSRRPERGSAPVIEGEPTPDELARLNRQLETRNLELQGQIDELRSDAEDRAASGMAAGTEGEPDAGAQLRALLGLKLQEDYEDLLALESEAPDVVVQQHYRALLKHVFEVLRQEGVAFKSTPEK